MVCTRIVNPSTTCPIESSTRLQSFSSVCILKTEYMLNLHFSKYLTLYCQFPVCPRIFNPSMTFLIKSSTYLQRFRVCFLETERMPTELTFLKWLTLYCLWCYRILNCLPLLDLSHRVLNLPMRLERCTLKCIETDGRNLQIYRFLYCYIHQLYSPNWLYHFSFFSKHISGLHTALRPLYMAWWAGTPGR